MKGGLGDTAHCPIVKIGSGVHVNTTKKQGKRKTDNEYVLEEQTIFVWKKTDKTVLTKQIK